MFVYDTECCQNEADDPVDAVLYFHPSWVSDTQKLSLCGQLMGTVHFLQENFGKTNVIALQNGKFILKTFGRFILVGPLSIVGFLTSSYFCPSLICFFFCVFSGCWN